MAVINWTNVTAFEQIPSQANVATNGGFWVGMLYMVWVILILMMLVFGWEIALLVASFVSLVLGLFLAYTGLISWGYAMFFAGMIFFMFLYITYTKEKRR
jgi:hypothetical protein